MGDYVKITHFINPHLFWFQLTKSSEFTEIRHIDTELNKHFQNIQAEINYIPKVYDKVAVNYLPFKRYIRGEVRSVVHQPNNSDEYIVWANDYGFPVKTDVSCMHPLPTRFAEYPNYVYRGGVANILPGIREMQPFVQDFVFKRHHNWSQYACEALEELLRTASSVRFVRDSQFVENGEHMWGELHVKNQHGETIVVSEHLAHLQFGILVQSDFLDLMDSMCTTSIPVWNTNNGNTNYKTNWYDKISEVANKHIYCDDTKMQRIAEWIKTPDSPAGCADSSVDQYGDNDISADDIQFGDSVSMKNAPCHDQTSVCAETAPHDEQLNLTAQKSIYDEDIQAGLYTSVATQSTTTSPNKVSEPNSNAFQKKLQKARLKSVNQSICSTSSLASNGISISIDRQSNSPKQSSLSTTSSTQNILAEKRKKLLNRSQNSLASDVSQKENLTEEHTPNLNQSTAKYTPKSVMAHSNASASSSIGSFKLRHLQQRKQTPSEAADSVNILNSEKASEDSHTSPTNSHIYREKKLDKFHKKRDRKSTGSTSVDSTPVGVKNECQMFDQAESVVSVDSAKSIPSSECSSHVQKLLEKRKKILSAKINSVDSCTPIEKPMKSQASDVPVPLTLQQKLLEKRLKLLSVKHSQEPSAKSERPAADASVRPDVESPFKPIEQKSEGANLGLKMLPAGYDQHNLNKYNDSENHWHCKASTRNGHVPHDMCSSPHSSGYVSYMNSTANRTDATTHSKVSTTSRRRQSTKSIEIDENFRHTRSHADKRKDSTKKKSLVSIFDNNDNDMLAAGGEHAIRPVLGSDLIVVHSKCALKPSERLEDVQFPPQITTAMLKRGITKMYRAQIYTWSHLIRSNSLVLVNPMGSGKTWSYVAPICSLVLLRTAMVTCTYGPMTIILVSSSKNVQRVCALCRDLFKECADIRVVAALGTRNLKDTRIELLDGCGILIATPASLWRIMELNEHESLIDYNYLRHFIIDELDVMLTQSKETLRNVYKTIVKMCTCADTGKLSLQLVVTSCYWNTQLMVPMLQSTINPLLCIGDFLEAMAYARIVFSVRFWTTEQKLFAVIDFIGDHPITRESLIVFCNNDDEINVVTSGLNDHGLRAVGYREKAEASAQDIAEDWKKQKGLNQVFVCCDTTFPELKIQNVKNIIHYSMPKTWTRFTRRFSALAQSIANYVVHDFEIACDKATVPHSYILLDELNNTQLPRLVDFFKKHCKGYEIAPEVLAVSKRVLIEREESRMKRNSLMCPYVLEFGSCSAARCLYRHNLKKIDLIKRGDDIPTSGDIRIHLLKVFSPTYYAVRILEHKPPEATAWREVRSSSKASLFALQLNVHYNQIANRKLYWPLEYGAMCVYRDADVAYRAHVVDFVTVDMKVIRTIKVTVKLVDNGDVKIVLSSHLYVCDEQFQKFPPQSMDIRLVGVLPVDNELDWDSEATKRVRALLHSERKAGDIVSASVNFAIRDVIWVNNVIVLESLPTIGKQVYNLNLRRILVEQQYGVQHNDNTNLIILREEYRLVMSSTADDAVDYVPLPEDDETAPLQPNALEICSVNANANEIIANEKLQFEEIAHEKSGALVSVERPIAKGKTSDEKWCGLPLHEIVKVEIGNELENGYWQNIYLQLVDNAHMNLLIDLFDMTQKHVAHLKATHTAAELIPDDWYYPMRNCLVRYEGNYLRAKLCGIFGTKPQMRLFRFFLCDYAVLLPKKESEVLLDFLYPTTDEIVAYTPYQAVHCKLAGIRLRDGITKQCKVTEEFLYAYAVKCLGSDTVMVHGLEIPSYEILFYEAREDDDFEHMTLFNRTLVTTGAADLDENTKNYLELDVNVSRACKTAVAAVEEATEQMENKPFTDFLECWQRAVQLEYEEICASNDCAVSAEELRQMKENKDKIVADIEKIRNMPNGQMVSSASPFPMVLDQTVAAENMQITEIENIADEQEAVTTNIAVGAVQPDIMAPAIAETKEVPKKSKKKKNKPKNHKQKVMPRAEVAKSSVMPALRSLNKRPHVTWYETDCLIYLTIHVPDVERYYLEVTPNTLCFSTTINGENFVLLLNFLGTVEPGKVSHEIRGLNVVVRLMKQYLVKWTRLLKQTTKFPWIKYNHNCILSSERAHVEPLHDEELMLHGDERIRHYESSEEDDGSDNENHLFQTYTPLDNAEDLHDPIDEI